VKSKLTIGRKIVLLATILLGLSAIVGVVSLLSLRSIDVNLVALTDDSIPGLDQIGMIMADVYRFRGDAWKHLASTDAQKMAGIEREMSDLKVELEQYLSEYGKTIHKEDDRANFTQLRETLNSYFRAWETVLPSSREAKKEEAYNKYLS